MSLCPEDCVYFHKFVDRKSRKGWVFTYAVCRKTKPQEYKAQSGHSPKDCYVKQKGKLELFGGERRP